MPSKCMCPVHSGHHGPDLLTSIHNHPRYDDPSAEPVVVHRRSKATKEIAESSQEKIEDSTTQALGGETDTCYTDINVDN